MCNKGMDRDVMYIYNGILSNYEEDGDGLVDKSVHSPHMIAW